MVVLLQQVAGLGVVVDSLSIGSHVDALLETLWELKDELQLLMRGDMYKLGVSMLTNTQSTFANPYVLKNEYVGTHTYQTHKHT